MKEYSKYKLVCDSCLEEYEFDTFEDAFKYAKIEGWGIDFVDGEWEHYCKEC